MTNNHNGMNGLPSQSATEAFDLDSIEAVDLCGRVQEEPDFTPVKSLSPTFIRFGASGAPEFSTSDSAEPKITGIRVITMDDEEYARMMLSGIANGVKVLVRPASLSEKVLEVIPLDSSSTSS